MIPQEKIEQAAGVANDYKHWEEYEAFKDGFYSGVRFAEAEMEEHAKQQAFPEYNEILYHAKTLSNEQFREYWNDVQGNVL